MIRLTKPVRLLEWGQGTNTTNQVWTPVGEGTIKDYTMKDGLTTLIIELNAPITKRNEANDELKIAQLGEGMAGASTRWGEVGLGHLRAVEQGGRLVRVQITTATKIDDPAPLRRILRI